MRHEYSGAAPATTLNGAINNSTLTITLASGTGYPTGSVGPFVITIDRGLATEETVLVDSRSGATLTVNASGRGYDGTSAQAHSAGATVEHTWAAAKANEFDAYVNTAMTGDVAAAANSKVTTIANNAVTLAKLVDATATARFLARVSSGSGDWEEATAAQVLAILALDSTDLTDFTEAVQDILGAFSGLGNSGLTFTYDDAGNAVTLVVNVDGATVEISSDAIRVKDGGITVAKLANDAVETAKIKDANVTTAKLAANSVTTAKIADAQVTTAKLDAILTARLALIDTRCGSKVSKFQTIANNTLSTVTFDTEESDPDGMWTVPDSTGSIPAGKGGLWSFLLLASWSGDPGDDAFVDIVIDGQSYSGALTAPNNITKTSASVGPIEVDAGDTISVAAYQNSGGDLNLTATLRAYRIGA